VRQQPCRVEQRPDETIMNRKIALALVVASAVAGPVLAEDGTIEPPPFVSTADRAQVVNEMQQYRREHVNPWADDYNPLATFHSERTRQEATREYIESRNAVAAMDGEDSGSDYLAHHGGGAAPTQMAVAPAADIE
jgi:hypothetical protein